MIEPAVVAPTRCGPTLLRWGTMTYVMGVINATPNSFSGDGLGMDVGAAVAQGERFVAEGAHILDVGGESTHPAALPVPEDVERARVLPVIAALARRVAVPIAVDTAHVAVAEAALAAGATMVNDVWGLHREPAIAHVVSRAEAALVVMHNRPTGGVGSERGEQSADTADENDVMAAILAWLRKSIATAEAADIPRQQILVDPGIGFGKTLTQNLEVLRRLDELRVLGLPVLLGTSRKGFIGRVLDLPVTERAEGTAATVALGIAAGADVVRVHDVQMMVRIARMSDAVVRGWPPPEEHPAGSN